MTTRVISDPSALGWELDATTGRWEWKAECDCPDVGGGGGGYLPSTEKSNVPAGLQYFGTGYHAGSLGGTRLGSPLCFGEEIYISWWSSTMNMMQWVRCILQDTGAVVTDGGSYSSLPSGVTYNNICNAGPWNVRLGNYVFQSRKGAVAFAKKESDNTLSFGALTDLGVDTWWNKRVSAHGCFESSDGESVIMIFTASSTTGMFAKVGLDANGDPVLLGKSAEFASSGTHGAISTIRVTEATYDNMPENRCYFYGHAHNSGNYTGYLFGSVRDDFGTLSLSSAQWILHHPSQTPDVTSDITAARYNNNRGFAFVVPIGTAHTAVVGPVVDSTGLISSQQWEANSSYWDSALIGSKGMIAADRLVGVIGSSSVGSTCGSYVKPSHRFKNAIATPSLPAIVTADAYLINSAGDRWHNVQVDSASYIPVPPQPDGQPVVRAAHNFWVCQGQTNDSNLYLFKDSTPVTRGVAKEVIKGKLETLKEIKQEQSE
jgi:hypothetical protein